MPKQYKTYRAVRVEFDQELWNKTQFVAEYDDRYLKTLVSEILRAKIFERHEEIKAEIAAAAEAAAAEAEENTKPDDHFLGLLDTHEGAAA